MTVSIEEHFGGAVKASPARDFQLVLKTGRVKHITPQAIGVQAFLPSAARLPITTGGPIFIIKNESECIPFCVFDSLGQQVGYVHKNSWARIFLMQNDSAHGVWGMTTCPVGGSEFTCQYPGGCDTSTAPTGGSCGGEQTTPDDGSTIVGTRGPDWGTGTNTVPGDNSGGDCDNCGTVTFLNIQVCAGGAQLFNPAVNLYGVAQNAQTIGFVQATTQCAAFDDTLQFNPVAVPFQTAKVAEAAGRTDIAKNAVIDKSLNQDLGGLGRFGQSANQSRKMPFPLRGINLFEQVERFRRAETANRQNSAVVTRV